MLRGEVIPFLVHSRVPDVNFPDEDGVHDDEASDDDAVDTENRNEHLHEQVGTAGTVETEASKDNEAKRDPKDNIIEVITDQVCANDDDTAGNMKNPQERGTTG